MHCGPVKLRPFALSRQNLPLVRHENEAENLCSRGGYIIKQSSQKNTKITIIATGSEVSIALDAQIKLENDNIPTCVVSMPCLDISTPRTKSTKIQL